MFLTTTTTLLPHLSLSISTSSTGFGFVAAVPLRLSVSDSHSRTHFPLTINTRLLPHRHHYHSSPSLFKKYKPKDKVAKLKLKHTSVKRLSQNWITHLDWNNQIQKAWKTQIQTLKSAPKRKRSIVNMPRSQQSESREVAVSKKLSYVLRHGAEKEGVKMDENGFVNCAEILAWQPLKSKKVTFDELQHIVATNAKKRFELAPISSPSSSSGPAPPETFETVPSTSSTTAATTTTPPEDSLASAPEPTPIPTPLPASSSDPSAYHIRASQGHSLPLASDKLLTPLDPLEPATPSLIVHGTTPQAWTLIENSGGLSRMGRSHVHFATGIPDSTSSKNGEEEVVISGMRSSASVLVWVDLKRAALEGGLKFWKSANGVVLTEGDARGFVGLEFVHKVERRDVSSSSRGRSGRGGKGRSRGGK